ncbi:hypothetical protein C4K27_2965 [Pseudomonas chlororaphis subsp. chlororaphis]|nr:hypothetical protein C4K27_2965 [Pseudomonas chlororaphis subsp. chlororaphis]
MRLSRGFSSLPVLERTTFITGRSPAQVLDFCLEGASFPKIFPERITPLAERGYQ